MDIEIRLERKADWRRVEEITRDAFWNLYVPGCSEHLIAHRLRTSPAFIGELDFVAVRGGEVVGNIMYSRAILRDGSGMEHSVVTFGPVSVPPPLQGGGIGSALIRHSMREAANMGFPAIVIYGYPGYYSRFGFANGKKFGICASDGRFMAALQALELFPGALTGKAGKFFEGEAYHAGEDEVKAFDKTFPRRKKSATESQKQFSAMADMEA